MIYRLSELALEGDQRERLQGYDPDFPYMALDCELDRYVERCVNWHWHATLEINVCVEGILETSTQRGTHRLRPGEGILVNANFLHRNRAADGMPGVRIFTHMFDRSLLAAAELPMRRYVRPLAECARLDVLVLSPQNAGQREILDLLHRAFAVAREEPPGFEMEICALLSQAWRALYEQARPLLGGQRAAPRPENARIKAMLSYIREHYAEEITPAKIGAAAGVCERECFRCFRQELGATPLASLTDFRVRMAARLLRETAMSVTEIASSCGFATPGYFGKVFRRRMNLSPLEYRKARGVNIARPAAPKE